MLQGKVECIIGLQLQLLDCPSGLSQYALACLWLKMIQLPREKGVPDCCVTVHDLARVSWLVAKLALAMADFELGLAS